MYGMNYSGGRNRTHGRIEDTPRIDSFEAAQQDEDGVILFGNDLLWCDRNTDYSDPDDMERVELYRPGTKWSVNLWLIRLQNGFGGGQAFWICPECGRRSRYLYYRFGRFSCRNCAKLNYRSQQETKDSMRHYRKGMELVNKHLTYSGPAPDGFEFPYFIPERPKGMRQSTYRRYLLRFLRYREKHTSRLIRDIGRLL